jgi:hypothetical protein
MTASARLGVLLPLANGDELSEADLRRRVFRFLHGFEGRGLRLQSGQQELWEVHDAAAAELKAVAKKVQTLFTTGFLFDGPAAPGTEGTGPDDIRLPLTFPSLRFGAFTPPKGRPRPDAMFTLIVEAWRLRDLVPFLAMHLLTTEGTTVSRCTAPAYRRWADSCNRFFVGSGLGRPRSVCSEACGARVKAKKVNEQRRLEREAWKAAQRAKATSRRTTTTRRRRKQ